MILSEDEEAQVHTEYLWLYWRFIMSPYTRAILEQTEDNSILQSILINPLLRILLRRWSIADDGSFDQRWQPPDHRGQPDSRILIA
jgi:hypothetical protein